MSGTSASAPGRRRRGATQRKARAVASPEPARAGASGEPGPARGSARATRARALPAATGSASRRHRDLEFLLHSSQEFTKSLDLPQVLSTISRNLLDVVPARRVGVLLREGDGTHLRLAAGCVRGEPVDSFPKGRLLPLGRYPEVRQALATHEPVVIEDVATSSLMAGVRDPVEAVGLRSLLVIPLLVRDACLGVLSLAQGGGRRGFSQRERSLIQAVANQAAVAIRNAQLFGELHASARHLEAKVAERTRRLEESRLRLAVLNQVTTAVNMSLDFEGILASTLANLQRLDNVDLAQAYLAAGDGGALVDVLQLDAGGRLRSERLRLPSGDSPDAVPVLSLAGHPIPLAGADPPREGQPAAHALAPVVSKDRVVGALQVFSSLPSAYGDADIDLLQHVAGEMSIALERTALYKAEQRRSRQFQALSDIGRRLSGAVTLDNLLPVAAQLIRESFDYDMACILILDEASGELVVAGAAAREPAAAARVAGHRQAASEGLCGKALREGKAVNARDVAADPSFLSIDGLPTRSELVVPIRIAGRPAGVIDLQAKAAGAFTDEDVAVLLTLADQLAAAMHLASLFDDLQEGRAFTERVLDNMAGGLIVTDRARTVQVINQRGAEMLRVERAELIGHDLLDVFPTAASLFQYSYEAIGRECDLTLRDGTRIPLGYSNAFFVDTRERKDAVIITFRDLSEVRELKRRVGHAERLATIGTVASGVAHEIRNPLFGISAVAQVLARELPADSPHAALLRGMLDETRRLNDLVTSLVQYGRPQELKLRALEPCRLWEEVIEMTGESARQARARVVHACQPGAHEGEAAAHRPVLEADRDQLKQVFLNLLLNAYDASPGGTITVDASWQDPDWFVTSIQDQGPGLTPEQVDKVFDLFYTTKPKGSGMGLAISSRIVADHGGLISASSPPHGGARFEVRLPVRRVERHGTGPSRGERS